MFKASCFAALAVAALASAGHVQADQPLKADVVHWWTSGGEAAALKVIADAYTRAGGQWVDSAVAGDAAARAAGINRIVGGNPPTMMQFNTGKQLDDLLGNGLLDNLDDAAAAGKWRDILPQPIIDASTRGGHVYALPINIHSAGWVWYNAKVFSDAGVEPPKNWSDVVAVAPALEAKGIIPLAHGGQAWQDKLLFDAILAQEGGRELYLGVYGTEPETALADPKFKHVAELFKSMRGLMDDGSPGRNWNDATALVITGKAAMQLMGDWAKGEFLAAGRMPGKDLGCVIPGDAVYLMGGDVFVFPKLSDENGKAAQRKLEDLLLSPEVQVAFNAKKGSIPVRTDVDTSQMDACAQKGGPSNSPARTISCQPTRPVRSKTLSPST
ncbi:ABC transporter substrate-binding protein (plasmid) [Rhizobium sp. CB3060]|uniref:ABC transporter substrate-binding protein n=1 Tax=Rhizobium sp. CB3060 TaxID=3138255 RepID=UPI0021A630CB|nr:ABC transporter substrate-binding protein [Rhizobium tropici]UWU26118.1 ABC transporter substrate-binding protein [Rhizobium tropici]